jgi:hypothetical protein
MDFGLVLLFNDIAEFNVGDDFVMLSMEHLNLIRW